MRGTAKRRHPAAERGPASGRARDAGVLLAWARAADGGKVHAARLDPAARRARAPFTCLGCGEPLVARLGPVRARHFAHLPGSTCPLTGPETALHLDAKERLLALCRDAFGGARRVVVLARCPACRRASPRDLAAVGDAAVEEGAVGALRADVLVTARGRPALALEVRVTHALDPAKEAALAAAGVPAVEIDAREEWERAGRERAEIVAARSVGFAPCAACGARARADADRARGGEAAELAELEDYRARGLLVAAPLAAPGARAAATGAALPAEPLSPADRALIARAFRCPDCGGRDLAFGERLARHRCPRAPDRPVAWRGYDGAVAALGWWRADALRGRR